MTNNIKEFELQRLMTHIKKLKANDTNVYHNARLLLRMYSDVVWNVQTDLNELSEKCREFSGDTVSFSTLAAMLEFDSSKKNVYIEDQLQSMEANSIILEIIHTAMVRLYEYPELGEDYYDILYKTYFNNHAYDDLCDALNLSRSTYFRRKKKAIGLFGQILWGYVLPDVIEQFKSLKC